MLCQNNFAGEMIVQRMEYTSKSTIEVEGWIKTMSGTLIQPRATINIYKRSDMLDVNQLIELWSEDDEIHSVLSSK